MGLLSWFGGAEKAVEKGGNDAIASRHASTVDTAQEYINNRFVDSYVTELKVKVADKCFQKCFDANNSSSKIDTSENGCQAMCCDRYLDTMEHVRKVLQQRSRK